jgi:hypothetical protein
MTSISHSDDEKAIPTSTSSEVTADKTEYLHSWRLAIVITSLFLGQFLMALDVNIINVAIPEITTPSMMWLGMGRRIFSQLRRFNRRLAQFIGSLMSM